MNIKEATDETIDMTMTAYEEGEKAEPGSEIEYEIVIKNYDEAERKAWEIMYENANEWYDDEAEEDLDNVADEIAKKDNLDDIDVSEEIIVDTLPVKKSS